MKAHTVKRRAILKHMKDNPNESWEKVAERFNVHHMTVRLIYKRAVNDGKI